MLSQHQAELASFPDILADCDWSFYAAAAAAGLLQIFTARADGVLIGYAVFIVRKHPHYKRHTWANNDVIWVHPDHRRGGVGRDFVRFFVAAFGEQGVDVMHMRTKVAHPELRHLLESLDFFRDEIGMSKRLNYGH
jgi:GNAT superfamily N-acetyltransferase